MNVWVLDHAAMRFVERVRPGMGHKQASIELARLVREFGREVPWPAWGPPRGDQPDRFAVEISTGILVICEPSRGGRELPRALTVVCRAGHPRQRPKRVRRAARRAERVAAAARQPKRRGLVRTDEAA